MLILTNLWSDTSYDDDVDDNVDDDFDYDDDDYDDGGGGSVMSRTWWGHDFLWHVWTVDTVIISADAATSMETYATPMLQPPIYLQRHLVVVPITATSHQKKT